MERSAPLDSPSRFVRGVERWKRGLTLFILFALGTAAGVVAGYAVYYAAGAIGLGVYDLLAATAAFAVVAPFSLGDRRYIRIIGSLANISDD